MNIKTYREMIALPTFEERFNYLKLDGVPGDITFGNERYLNQKFYKSLEWLRLRDRVILRDNGCDLGDPQHPIFGRIIIHHMNPIAVNDVLEHSEVLIDENQLICVSHNTHNALHYSDENQLPKAPIERKPNDQCPWR